jgi:hypothetical protein
VTTNFIFIDSCVAGYQSDVAGLVLGTEWCLINSGEDGFAQMARALAGRSQLDPLQIVSLGSSGSLLLGATRLNAQALTPCPLSRTSRNQTGKRYHRPCAEITDVLPIYVPAHVPGSSGRNVANRWVYGHFPLCAIRANGSVAHGYSSRKLSRVSRLVTKKLSDWAVSSESRTELDFDFYHAR